MFSWVSESLRPQMMAVAAVVAIFELVSLLWFVARILHQVVAFAVARGPGEAGGSVDSLYRAYEGIMKLFQHVLPTMGSFSAIKNMEYVHPSLLYEGFMEFIQESRWQHRTGGLVVLVIMFVLGRAVALVFAVSAFAIKLMQVA